MVVEVKTQFETILDQHRELRDLIETLKSFLEQPRPEVGAEEAHDWASGLAGQLTRLHDQIYRHFREEEQSGFLDELGERHPRALHAIEVLRQDHGRILGDLRAILGAAMVYSEGKMPVAQHLRQWTASVLDRLARHEREETELFQTVTYHDLGTGD